MRIIVNHITRMRNPRICVAGLDSSTLAAIRPTTPPTDLITRTLLRSEGGPFGPGALVDLGVTVSEGVPPEIEDHRFVTTNARHVEDLSDDLYLAALAEVAASTITAAFGKDIVEVRSRKFAVPAGRGARSLAVLEVASPILLTDYGNLYVIVDDGEIKAKLRVTDVRFYESDHKTLKQDLVKSVGRRLASDVETYAMLGLARAMVDSDGGNVHWLQCNGICLADRAVSDVP